MATSIYAPGALVRARGRDWVVMPADEQNVLRLRPVDGADEDTVGLYLPIEGGEGDLPELVRVRLGFELIPQ